jgi:hypothetical protein
MEEAMVIMDPGMGTMAAIIRAIMVDTMGVDIIIDKTMAGGIMVAGNYAENWG